MINDNYLFEFGDFDEFFDPDASLDTSPEDQKKRKEEKKLAESRAETQAKLNPQQTGGGYKSPSQILAEEGERAPSRKKGKKPATETTKESITGVDWSSAQSVSFPKVAAQPRRKPVSKPKPQAAPAAPQAAAPVSGSQLSFGSLTQPSRPAVSGSATGLDLSGAIKVSRTNLGGSFKPRTTFGLTSATALESLVGPIGGPRDTTSKPFAKAFEKKYINPLAFFGKNADYSRVVSNLSRSFAEPKVLNKVAGNTFIQAFDQTRNEQLKSIVQNVSAPKQQFTALPSIYDNKSSYSLLEEWKRTGKVNGVDFGDEATAFAEAERIAKDNLTKPVTLDQRFGTLFQENLFRGREIRTKEEMDEILNSDEVLKPEDFTYVTRTQDVRQEATEGFFGTISQIVKGMLNTVTSIPGKGLIDAATGALSKTDRTTIPESENSKLIKNTIKFLGPNATAKNVKKKLEEVKSFDLKKVESEGVGFRAGFVERAKARIKEDLGYGGFGEWLVDSLGLGFLDSITPRFTPRTGKEALDLGGEMGGVRSGRKSFAEFLGLSIDSRSEEVQGDKPGVKETRTNYSLKDTDIGTAEAFQGMYASLTNTVRDDYNETRMKILSDPKLAAVRPGNFGSTITSLNAQPLLIADYWANKLDIANGTRAALQGKSFYESWRKGETLGGFGRDLTGAFVMDQVAKTVPAFVPYVGPVLSIAQAHSMMSDMPDEQYRANMGILVAGTLLSRGLGSKPVAGSIEKASYGALLKSQAAKTLVPKYGYLALNKGLKYSVIGSAALPSAVNTLYNLDSFYDEDGHFRLGQMVTNFAFDVVQMKGLRGRYKLLEQSQAMHTGEQFLRISGTDDYVTFLTDAQNATGLSMTKVNGDFVESFNKKRVEDGVKPFEINEITPEGAEALSSFDNNFRRNFMAGALGMFNIDYQGRQSAGRVMATADPRVVQIDGKTVRTMTLAEMKELGVSGKMDPSESAFRRAMLLSAINDGEVNVLRYLGDDKSFRAFMDLEKKGQITYNAEEGRVSLTDKGRDSLFSHREKVAAAKKSIESDVNSMAAKLTDKSATDILNEAAGLALKNGNVKDAAKTVGLFRRYFGDSVDREVLNDQC